MVNYCAVSGKIRYDNPAEGYREISKRGKKSYSQKTTTHYKCSDCKGYHMLTVDKKRK